MLLTEGILPNPYCMALLAALLMLRTALPTNPQLYVTPGLRNRPSQAQNTLACTGNG